MSKTTWIYVSDMSSHGAKIWNPDTNEIRTITAGHVRERAPIGMRRGLLEEHGGQYTELGAYAPYSDALHAELEEAYRDRNGWMLDYPHYQLGMDEHVAEARALRANLEGRMAKHPFDFQITGLDRRYLMYCSDGDKNSQKRFVGLSTRYGQDTPYRRDGSLRRRYEPIWSSDLRDKGVPFPHELDPEGDKNIPVLYHGPAYALRFLLDGQIPAFNHCFVYVTPDGDFIGSDWCQRHDFTSYGGGGINLQMGIYDVDVWITTSCVQHAIKQGCFKPKHTSYQTVDVRTLLKGKSLVTVPTFDEAMTIAADKLAKKCEDPLQSQIAALMTAHPEWSTDALVERLVETLDVARTQNDAASLHGLPFYVRKKQVPEERHAALATLQVTDSTFAFTAAPRGTCAVTEGSQVCLRHTPTAASDPETSSTDSADLTEVHEHFYVSLLAFNYRKLRWVLWHRVEAERQRRAPAVDEAPGPITAESIRLADEAFQRAQTLTTYRMNADRLAQALRMGLDLVPIEREFSGTKGSFGRARFYPRETGAVEMEWLTGLYSHPEKIAVYEQVLDEDLGERTYRRLEYLRPKAAWATVQERSAAWHAMEWWFHQRHLEQAQREADTTSATSAISAPSAPSAALAEAMTTADASTSASTSASTTPSAPPQAFEHGGLPYVATVLDTTARRVRLQSPITGDDTIVQRAANGHVYQVLPDGTRIALETSAFRDAAVHVFKVILTGATPALAEV
jgi:hypothetical protein